MRLSAARVEQTLNQFEARVLSDSHPSMPKIKELWGDHTYFVAVNGLNIVEPLERRDTDVLERRDTDVEAGAVVKLANWSDPNATTPAPPEPEATQGVVEVYPKAKPAQSRAQCTD